MVEESKKPVVHMIGHAHIDPVFLWRWMEGYEAVKLTFRATLERMNENERYMLSTSSAAFFEWLERFDPALFAQVRERVREGRWELVGGWWVEPDANLPHGESFVRQALYGQRYFREKFGVQATVAMNPDTFGHAWTLPQIIAKSGCHSYVFMRPAWFEKELPANLFWWESPDGSRVLTCRLTTYGGNATAQSIAEVATSDFYQTRNKVHYYGAGDHGGGPTIESIANIQQDIDAGGVARFSGMEPFFRAVQEEGVSFPVVRDELQHHAQGCYSTLSELKKRNRRDEHLLMTAEKVCAIAQRVADAPYPSEALKRAWRDVLYLQFHDNLGGTIPKDAYEDALDQYGHATQIAQEALYGGVHALSNQINTSGEGFPLLVINPSAWPRRSPVEVTVERRHWGRSLQTSPQNWWCEGCVRIVDDEGREVPSQFVFPTAHCGFGRVNVLFLADVPALGYRVYQVLPPETLTPCAHSLQVGGSFLENARWRLDLDQVTGNVTRLYDKKNELEVLSDVGNRGVVIDDPYDTWAHEVDSFQHEIGAFGNAQISILESGPVRASLLVRTAYGHSTMEQIISLYEALDRIEITATVHWHEQHKMLKIEWPLNVSAPTVTSEIPYGHIVRLSKGNEEPGGRWLDVSGRTYRQANQPVNYGVTVVNDCKYAYDVWARYRPYGWGTGKAIVRITALRSPIFVFHEPNEEQPGLPYPYQDQGPHTFRYALLPHEGTWQEHGAPAEGEAFNTPLVVINADKHEGPLPSNASFVQVTPENAQVTVLKQAEEGDALIVRCVEVHGQDTQATIRLPQWNAEWSFALGHDEIKSFKVSRDGQVQEVDLLEDAI